MKFTLIIDEHRPEEVVVTARKRSDLTDKIEALVCSADKRLLAYREDETVMLDMDGIVCITVQDGKTYALTPKISVTGSSFGFTKRKINYRPGSSASINLPSPTRSTFCAFTPALAVRWMRFSGAVTQNMFQDAALQP